MGESGSGKSVTSLAIMRLTPPPPRAVIAGQVLFRDRDGAMHDLLALPEAKVRAVRGNEISMIFQEPLTSLNPVHTVGAQIVEAITYHEEIGRRAALARAEEPGPGRHSRTQEAPRQLPPPPLGRCGSG